MPLALRGDPLMVHQWSMPMGRVEEAWEFATGRNVTIAIIDSRIDLTHPDLKDRLLLVEGAAFVGGSLQDEFGHGTGTAGIAAATANNGIGIAGVAPEASIMPIRVFTTGGAEEILAPGFTQRIADSIRFAADHGAWSKGSVLVGSAGNSGGGGPGFPWCGDPASHPLVLCVGAVGPDGNRASYSQMDTESDFVVAPGGALLTGGQCRGYILTTRLNGTENFCPIEDGGGTFAYDTGTSYAAAYVAGIAALLVEQGLANEEIVEPSRPRHILGQALGVAVYYHLQRPRPAMSNAIDTMDLMAVLSPDNVENPKGRLDDVGPVRLDFSTPLPNIPVRNRYSATSG